MKPFQLEMQATDQSEGGTDEASTMSADEQGNWAARLKRWQEIDDLHRLRAATAQAMAESEATQPFIASALEKISNARTLDRASYYVDRLAKAFGEPRPAPNSDINLNRWQDYGHLQTDSLWVIPRRDRSGAHSAGYWGNFIPQIPRHMIERYSRAGEVVLDPFVGSGTTLIEAQRLGRHAVGIDLNPKAISASLSAVETEPNPTGVRISALQGDSCNLNFGDALAELGHHRADLAILHPPYHDIIQFSEAGADLSNCTSVDSFLSAIGMVIEGVHAVLGDRRYMVIVIGDKYANGEWIPIGFRTMEVALVRGFLLKSIVVKNFDDTLGKRSQKELWRYRALAGGFFVFKHEYIFILERT